MKANEEKVKRIGKKLFDLCKKQNFSDYLKNKMILWGAKNQELKTQALRFVDVLPVLKTSDEINEHFQMYVGSAETLPFPLKVLLKTTENPLTSGIAANAIKFGIKKTAKKFIAGSNIKEIKETITSLEKDGFTSTLDILGEATASEREAELYAEYYQKLIGYFREINVSVKPSSLYSQFDPINFEESAEITSKRIEKIFGVSRRTNVSMTLDAEQYQYRDLTIEIFLRILRIIDPPQFPGEPQHIAMAYQAYYKDSLEVLRGLISKIRKLKLFLKPTIRLVKGAYWDWEVINAKQKNWPIPVFAEKWQTDENFERAIDLLLENSDVVRVAVASHNIRSIAYAMAKAEEIGFDHAAERLEFQGLYGMAEIIGKAALKSGYNFRMYLPCLYPEGKLTAGMAYLARRLLENTSNESFLLQSFIYNRSTQELLASPREKFLSKIEGE